MYYLQVRGSEWVYWKLDDDLDIQLTMKVAEARQGTRPEMARLKANLEAYQAAIGEPLRFDIQEVKS
jgi:hypothetical protein